MTSIIQQPALIELIKSARYFHTCDGLNGINRVMRKVMGYTAKKNHRYVETPTLPNPSSFSEGAYEGKRSGCSRRSAVLNKLFMTHITDLMMTGESAPTFAGYGIEINKVQVTPDYKGVNVFWVAKGTENDEKIETLLKCNSGQIRHELTQLRVMGAVPRIYFVKDKHYAQIVEVDIRLAKADFGEDHVPLEPAVKLRSHLELNMKLEPHLKETIAKLEEETVDEGNDIEEIPPMPQDVLGLNHSEIMGRVLASITKSQALHRLENISEEKLELPTSYNLHPVEYSNARTRREAFKQFLLQRQILKSKACKQEKNYRPELEFLEDEWEATKKQHIDSFMFDDAFDIGDDFDDDEECNK